MSDRSASRIRRKPAIEVELAETSPRWRERLPRRRALCVAAAAAAFAAAKPRLTRRTEVSVVLADDALVRRLNREIAAIVPPRITRASNPSSRSMITVITARVRWVVCFAA